MSGPLAVEPIMQKDSGDCGAASLAMYLSIPYRQVCDAALKVVPDFFNHGMTRGEMVTVARLLGYDLKRSAKFNLEEDNGVMFMHYRKSYHAVLLFGGVLINPSDGLIWLPEAYINKSHFKPVTLLHTVDTPPK